MKKFSILYLMQNLIMVNHFLFIFVLMKDVHFCADDIGVPEDNIQAADELFDLELPCAKQSQDDILVWYFSSYEGSIVDQPVYDSSDANVLPPDTNIWHVRYYDEEELITILIVIVSMFGDLPSAGTYR